MGDCYCGRVSFARPFVIRVDSGIKTCQKRIVALSIDLPYEALLFEQRRELRLPNYAPGCYHRFLQVGETSFRVLSRGASLALSLRASQCGASVFESFFATPLCARFKWLPCSVS